jgi:hypothetical protein
MTQKDPTVHKRRTQRHGKKTTPSKAAPSAITASEMDERAVSSDAEQEPEWDQDDMQPGEDIAGMQRPPDDS